MFILALAVACFRTFVRWHYRKLAWLDDGFLALAVVLMIVSLGLWFAMMDNLYKTEALIYDPFGSAVQFGDIVEIAIDVQIYSTAYIAITLTGIFAIKFSFLFFFRSLINRLRPMVMYWRVVVGYTAVSWAISLGISFLACPYYDSRAIQCAQDSMLARALDVSIALLVFDVSSDLLIISIPALVIRKVKIPLRSKTYLAFSFCLSAVMIVCAVLQGATLETGGIQAIDVVWQIYFQIVELTLAVMVVSLTAFRTFFIQRGSRNNTPRAPNPKWYSYKKWKKSVSDRTTSTGFTGMTGFTGFSEEMQLPDAPGRPAGSAPPNARDLPTETPPSGDSNAPLSPGDIGKRDSSHLNSEKGLQFPRLSRPIATRTQTPTTLDGPMPISPQTPFSPTNVPPHTPSPAQPVSHDSSDSSSGDIEIPIQGSRGSPESLTPLYTPILEPVIERPPPPPPDPPRLGSLTSSSTAAGPGRTPPAPKPLSSASSAPRTALMGPAIPSTHTSRTDSLSRPLTGHNAGTLEAVPKLPQLPPPLHLPHALPESGTSSIGPITARASTEFPLAVPARKPLLTAGASKSGSRPMPSPTPSKASSIAAAAANLGLDDCFGSISPRRPSQQRINQQRHAEEWQRQQRQQQRENQGSESRPLDNHYQRQQQPRLQSDQQRQGSDHDRQAQVQMQVQAQGYEAHPNLVSPLGTSVPVRTPTPTLEPPSSRSQPPPASTSPPRSPRTPRRNLSPDLRISSVQRAIRNGIERAMSLEPAAGEGESW